LDEIGRGTSTFDGISLAWAITEHIHDSIGCRTLFATHYHELVELEKTKPRLHNANVAVRESDEEILFLYQIIAGGADQSFGIHVARLAGVPAPVLERARQILKFLEKQHGPDPGLPEAPIKRKVKTGRALTGSLFAALPDPLLTELRQAAIDDLTPEQATGLLRRLRELAD
jgi:DNA mismatch repair protein MutS